MDGIDYSDLDKIDPGAFEWLDLAEAFFKHDGSFGFGEERNSKVVRAGKRYESIEREFNQLRELYEACPEHVVEPVMPIYREEENGKNLVGFYMERFEGEVLKDYLLDLTGEEEIREGLEIVEELCEVVESLHEEGVVHGDLTNNILYDGETFRIIDPVGEPYDDESYDDMKAWDESTPERLEKSAKAPLFIFE